MEISDGIPPCGTGYADKINIELKYISLRYKSTFTTLKPKYE